MAYICVVPVKGFFILFYNNIIWSFFLQTNELNEDVIPIPPWTILVPTTEGRSDIIPIPTDKHISSIDIPDHVTHVCKDINVFVSENVIINLTYSLCFVCTIINLNYSICFVCTR